MMAGRPVLLRLLFSLCAAGAAAIVAAAALWLPAGGARPAEIDPQVYAALAAAPDGQATFILLMADRADLSGADRIADWAERGRYVYEALRKTAARSQAPLAARQRFGAIAGQVSEFEPFWIVNAVVVHGNRQAAEALARQPGVSAILPEMKLDAPEPPDAQPAAAVKPDAVTYGIDKINADDVWRVYGVRGEGTVVGLVDTGVQWDHPALQSHYRGWNGSAADHNYNWWDPANFCGAAGSAPCDVNGHGTHTTGTTTGGTDTDEIGVAPGAKWIHAAGCCASNASLLSSLQWMLAPTDMDGNNADPARRPNVVNNSWGGPGGSQIFEDAIANLVAAGIVPVFSAGNDGLLACGSLGSPGDNLPAFNVGATDSNDAIAYFSSRGSNPFDRLTDPDVTAPGVSVRSSTRWGQLRLQERHLYGRAACHRRGRVGHVSRARPGGKGGSGRGTPAPDRRADHDDHPVVRRCAGDRRA